MTRARQYLQILVPQRLYVSHQSGNRDRQVYGSPTRIIPAELGVQFEPRGPACATGSAEVMHPMGVRR